MMDFRRRIRCLRVGIEEEENWDLETDALLESALLLFSLFWAVEKLVGDVARDEP